MTRGTGPKSVPASLVKTPAWMRAMLVAAAEVGRASRRSLDGASGQPLAAAPARSPASGGLASKSTEGAGRPSAWTVPGSASRGPWMP